MRPGYRGPSVCFEGLKQFKHSTSIFEFFLQCVFFSTVFCFIRRRSRTTTNNNRTTTKQHHPPTTSTTTTTTTTITLLLLLCSSVVVTSAPFRPSKDWLNADAFTSTAMNVPMSVVQTTQIFQHAASAQSALSSVRSTTTRRRLTWPRCWRTMSVPACHRLLHPKPNPLSSLCAR